MQQPALGHTVSMVKIFPLTGKKDITSCSTVVPHKHREHIPKPILFCLLVKKSNSTVPNAWLANCHALRKLFLIHQDIHLILPEKLTENWQIHTTLFRCYMILHSITYNDGDIQTLLVLRAHPSMYSCGGHGNLYWCKSASQQFQSLYTQQSFSSITAEEAAYFLWSA